MCSALFSLSASFRAVHSEEGEESDESLCFVFSYPVTWSAWAASAGCFFLSPEFRSECCMLQSPPTVCSAAVRGRR